MFVTILNLNRAVLALKVALVLQVLLGVSMLALLVKLTLLQGGVARLVAALVIFSLFFTVLFTQITLDILNDTGLFPKRKKQ